MSNVKSMPQRTQQMSPEDILNLQAKMMSKKERLVPELQQYVEHDASFFGITFRHPLLVVTPVDVERSAWINWVVKYNEQYIADLRQKGDWEAVLCQYETPFLLHGFCNEIEHFDDETYWTLLADVWIRMEQLWQDRSLLLRLLQSPRPQRDCMMTKPEHRAFAKLPMSFAVYRGFGRRRGKGLSWTTDEKKAIWFAKRFAEDGDAKVVSGIAKKKDVLAFFTRRKESEIVIDPKKVRSQEVQTL